jgi:choline dehydrogenase
MESELHPGAEVQTRDELIDDFRKRSGSVYHPCGTCAMGPDARGAVVDAALRVHGIAGLRVVDASIFPTVTSGNINAAVIMVAEKAADLITKE